MTLGAESAVSITSALTETLSYVRAGEKFGLTERSASLTPPGR